MFWTLTIIYLIGVAFQIISNWKDICTYYKWDYLYFALYVFLWPLIVVAIVVLVPCFMVFEAVVEYRLNQTLKKTRAEAAVQNSVNDCVDALKLAKENVAAAENPPVN